MPLTVAKKTTTKKAAVTKAMNFSNIKKIRFIKLGKGGEWADDCFNKGIIRIGFHSGVEEVYQAAIQNKYGKINEYWRKKQGRNRGTATGYSNQTKEFFEDDGSTLWVTFEAGFLYYGVSDGAIPKQDLDFPHPFPTCYRSMKYPWNNRDAKGKILELLNLSGMITKTHGYRGTICKFDPEVLTDIYLKAKLSGHLNKDISAVEDARKDLVRKIKPLIKSLRDYDFETLCELIFSNSGWRRISRTGGTQKTVDFILQNPVTGDNAFVQVKTNSTQKVFETYVAKKSNMNFGRMFYIYHEGDVNDTSDDPSISLWDLDKVSEQVLDNGLVDWVIGHAK